MKKQAKYLGISLIIIVVVTSLAVLFNHMGIRRENALLLFVAGVLITAYFTEGYRYGMLTSVWGALAYNYFFTMPYMNLAMSDRNDVILLTFFLIAAFIATNLAVRFQKQVEIARELSQEQERIKYDMEREQMRSNLLRSISHDLRTPLTGIAGASALIMDEKKKLDEATIRDLAAGINEQVDWLSQMVENILNMTRIESGNLQIDRQAEAVEDLINNAITGIHDRGGGRTVEAEIPEEMIMVDVDGRLIVQVLINFLDNAIKNTREDGWIRLKVTEGENEIWFACEDNGRGIKPELLSTIFDEFMTDKRVNQDSEKGIGLGLSICRAIVQIHGGRIEALNRREGGACVRFSLPYGKDI